MIDNVFEGETKSFKSRFLPQVRYTIMICSKLKSHKLKILIKRNYTKHIENSRLTFAYYTKIVRNIILELDN